MNSNIPEKFRLCSAAEVPLDEQVLLPSTQGTSCERFVPFPVESEYLRPHTPRSIKQDLPRFSLFSGIDRLILNGFHLFETDGVFFTDASLVLPEADSCRVVEKWRSTVGQPEGIDFNLIGTQDKLMRIERDGPIFLPQSSEPSNFGSWLFRFLPKLLMAKQAGERVNVLAYVHPGWTRNILNLIGVDYEIIPHNPVQRYLVTNPVIPSLAVPNVLFRPEILEHLWSLIDEQVDGYLGEKIYVSRLGQTAKRPNHRNLQNEQELLDRLLPLGFTEFRPEDYSLAQQISIFANAKVIVGVGGSNMFGCIFARKAQFIIDIESGLEWMFAHANLLSSVPAHFSIVKGVRMEREETFPHVAWIVDVDALIKGIAKLELI